MTCPVISQCAIEDCHLQLIYPLVSRSHWTWPFIVDSIDWLKEKIKGKSHISGENLWFAVDVPLSQPIEGFERWEDHFSMAMFH